MSNKVDKCPLCDQAADLNFGYAANDLEGGYGGECARCGRIRVMERVVTQFGQTGTRHLLSAFFRRYPESVPPLVTIENVNELIAGLPVLKTVRDKMDGLLRLLADPKQTPGSYVLFDPQKDYPLVFAANPGEASFLLGQLSTRRFVVPVIGANKFMITADGYERVEELQALSYKSIRNAFVAMWFDKSRDFIYKEAIEPAIREAGYRAVRIDMTEYVNRIDDEIIAQLRQSRFLVADFTGQRAGVYYEAGFMHGLGRKVFWMVEKQDLVNVHFDVRQYNFIDYESASEARRRLHLRILAQEGNGTDLSNDRNSASV